MKRQRNYDGAALFPESQLPRPVFGLKAIRLALLAMKDYKAGRKTILTRRAKKALERECQEHRNNRPDCTTCWRRESEFCIRKSAGEKPAGKRRVKP